MRLSVLLAMGLAASSANSQWVIQQSHSTASLRGIHNVGGGIAWASGSEGTVLRTTNGGKVWQKCAVAPGAEKLDFRGVQAFDAKTAIVMSSGPGEASRIYKTMDGCRTWKVVLMNPDKDGFFDGLQLDVPAPGLPGKFADASHATGTLIGDPVDGSFAVFLTTDGGSTWTRRIAAKKGLDGCKTEDLPAKPQEALFAASNESLKSFASPYLFFVTGGATSRLVYTDMFAVVKAICHVSTYSVNLPMVRSGTGAGAFAVATTPRIEKFGGSSYPYKVMVVGGDYEKPDSTAGTSVLLMPTKLSPLKVAGKVESPLHGYRSAVAYDTATNAWIAVGPNGTDVSPDDGKNWRALQPSSGDPADADKGWNALSLPFVVGNKGRIGVLRDGVVGAAR